MEAMEPMHDANKLPVYMDATPCMYINLIKIKSMYMYEYMHANT